MFHSVRSYFRRLAQDDENGTLPHLLHPLLEAASTVYGSTARLTRFLYDRKWLVRRRLPFPVVSVGNLTWGGTGKTPFVEYLGRKVTEHRRTPLVLTRGYSQDEVRQFQHHLGRAVIGVGKDRWRVAGDLSKTHVIDIAILDDGLQHWPLERDLEVIMVNALNPFGNHKILPRGILREPISVLKRASVLVISHANLVGAKELDRLRSELQSIAPEAFLVEAYLEPLFFYRAQKRARVSLDKLRRQRVTTFSGIGTPRSFQMMLSRFQIRPARNFEFEDHHVYTEKELREIRDVSQAASVEEIITTEKDFYRCPELIAERLNPLVLATRMSIAAGEEGLTERLFRLTGVTSG